MAVIKADGYGHGASAIARIALEEGAFALGVLTPDEGIHLRDGGITAPIYLLCPPLGQDADAIVHHKLIPAVDSLVLAKALHSAQLKRKKKKTSIPIVLDLDFGLGRWGIPPHKTINFAEKIRTISSLRIDSLATHLDYIPGKNIVEAEEKLQHFAAIGQRLRKNQPALSLQAANSTILVDFPRWQLNQVRIGNLIYGINPTKQPLRLQRPWRFCAKITAIKKIAKGQSIGYSSEFLAPKSLRVATVPVGYSDGLTMEPAHRAIRLGGSQRYWGMLNNEQLPFVGSCGISHVLLDISNVPSAKLGDTVELPVRRTAANLRIPRIYRK